MLVASNTAEFWAWAEQPPAVRQYYQQVQLAQMQAKAYEAALSQMLVLAEAQRTLWSHASGAPR